MAYLVIKELGAERTLPMTDGEVSVGRSRQNEVKLVTEQASRKHCKLVKTDKGFQIVDFQSSNGTFVNGLKIDEKILAEGDVIGIGHATLTFHDGDAPSPPPPPAPPEQLTAAIPLHDRNVQILLSTIIEAGASQDLDAFLTLAIDNIIDIVQAERGILLLRDDAGQLQPRVARDSARKPLAELVGLSRSIPQQVFETKKAIYLLDTEQDHESVRSESVSIYHLRTVMCAPMRVGDKLLGVVYVDSHAKTREYSEVDLALFEAVTNYLALTIENVRAQTQAKRRDEEKRRVLEQENARLRGALEKRRHLIGQSPAMQSVYETLRKVAPTDATVLILGESGTGKEAIAQAIHDLSPRGTSPFVVIDGAAIPETLLESELFGYEKGAFTGAAGPKPGKLELAHGGTVFLDEVGELSTSLQAKLLRALEQKTVTRVGGTEPVQVDARLIAATNLNLERAIKDGKFRQDLYFRLKVVTVTLPPLRERLDDILLLAQFLLEEANAANGRSVKDFSDEAKFVMLRHRWEGNIRELKHRIEQAVILTNNEYLSTEDLGLTGDSAEFRPLETARDLFEKNYIVKALSRHGYVVTHTAKALGISRQHLQNLIKKYAIPKATDTDE
ncbi:MAG: sigma 54-interacting transcriptional regulator [Planctomycetes bacterium]|nr:sigma 54-interacting transcriptional regulator [Planctomycetota bacterium]